MKLATPLTRRRLLSGATVTLAAAAAPVGAALVPTPRQSRGPYYPVEYPFDQDNDLVHVAGRSSPARGEVVVVRGHVYDERGRPGSDTRVEIWQCDANGRYHHPRDRRNAPLDENFQGWGSYLTSSDGRYFFRTIHPVAYPGRAPHIHFAISGPGFEPLVTQLYVDGAPRTSATGCSARFAPRNSAPACSSALLPIRSSTESRRAPSTSCCATVDSSIYLPVDP